MSTMLLNTTVFAKDFCKRRKISVKITEVTTLPEETWGYAIENDYGRVVSLHGSAIRHWNTGDGIAFLKHYSSEKNNQGSGDVVQIYLLPTAKISDVIRFMEYVFLHIDNYPPNPLAHIIGSR